MSYQIYSRQDCNVGFEFESAFRSGAAVEANIKPFDIFDEIEIPEPFKEWEELYPVHAGRNVGNIGDKTYPVADGSIETNLQSGIWLYYVLGATADVLVTTVWTHTITEANDLPSFKIHFEQKNPGTGNPIIRDLIGCMVTELNLSIKKEDLIKQTISFLVPKSLSATVFATAWSSFNFSTKTMNWDMSSLTTFNVDTVDLLTAWGTIPIESLDINIKNDIENLPNLGDAWFNEAKIGKREYEVKMLIYPKDDDLYLARDKHPEDYTGALTFLINRGTDDTITLTFSDMYVSDYPNKIPNLDDKSVGVEVTFRNSPGGTLGAVVVDALDETYYDQVDDT